MKLTVRDGWSQLNISVKPEVRQRLERLHQEYGWSKSQLVAEALRHFEQTSDAEIMGPVDPVTHACHASLTRREQGAIHGST